MNSIGLLALKVTNGKQAATVNITNPANGLIAGAKVTGVWSGVVAGTASGTTDASGNVVVTSKTFKKSGAP